MPRLKVIEEDTAEGKTKELLGVVKSKMGKVPNILKGMANSPAALESYLQLSGVLSGAQLTGEEQEAIALAVAQKNNCNYCLSAHTVIAASKGIDADSALKIRKGDSGNPKLQALTKFALEVLDTKGFVSDDSLSAFKSAGYSDGQVAEVVACVALNVYTNYFNHVNDTEIDFPKAPEL